MTLQRGGELSIVRALSGSSRGDAQPPISHPPLCKENRMQRFLFAMFRIELFFTIENTRLHLFSFFKCGKCGGNFVRFKKYIGGIGEMTYIYIYIQLHRTRLLDEEKKEASCPPLDGRN